MPLIPPGRRRALAAGALSAALVATGPHAAHAAPAGTAAPTAPTGPGGSTASTPQGEEFTVTLLTGDRVRIVDGPGDADAVTVARPAGAEGGVQVRRVSGDTYVLPDEAVPLITAGSLDERLFNVTTLIEMGYDDARSDGLPVITTYAGALPRTVAAPRGAEVVRRLPSIRGAALTAGKKQARVFWEAIASGGARRLAGGVDRIWLDGKARAALKDSVPRVGAPQAWAAGFDGTGVKVAVLDTGVDDTHPDLSGRIAEKTSFVPGEDAGDADGHGTHVASTIAGTGAASSGANKGVAPGADLVIGKVLGNDGYGQDSWIIAGMEWAAAQGAAVVNMSLGSSVPDEGDDPMALAVDRLSEQYGTLFVIAAGNSYSSGSIGAPGSAATALTVGAVDTSDRRAEFSSWGPLVRTGGLKPDLSAPGVAIEAARSSLSPGEGPYRSLDGTSMATPHVAGAAAILAQRHPDWTGQRLKDALMSTAAALPYEPFQQGTGRLDVAAAITAAVTATGSVPAAFYDWPHAAGDEKATRTIAYRNHGDAEVTLDLAVSGSGAAALSAPRVTVPAGGRAEVTLTLDPAALEPGTQVSGLVTAVSGTTVLRTAFGAVKERELHDLTLKLRDRDGEPADGTVVLADLNGDATPYAVSGERTLRLPPGTYMAWSVLDVRGERADALGVAMLVDPETVLDRPSEIVLDASRARRASATTPRAAEDRQRRLDFHRAVPSGPGIRGAYLLPVRYDDVYVSPTGKVATGSFGYLTRWRKGEPRISLAVPGRPEIAAVPQPGGAIKDGRAVLRTVRAGTGAAGDYAGLDARGKAVVVRRSDEVPPAERAAQAVKAGASLLLVVNDRPGVLSEYYGEDLPITIAALSRDTGENLGRTLVVTRTAFPSYLYDLADVHPAGVPDRDLTYRADERRNLARVTNVMHGALTPQTGGGYRYDLPAGWGPGAGFEETEVFPATRTEWVSTGPGVTWYENHTIGDGLWEMRQTPRVYRPGERAAQEWFGPVVRPRVRTEYWGPFRQGNDMQFNIPSLADGSPAHSGSDAATEYDTSSIALYQGDKLIRKQPGRALVAWDGIAPEALPYRLVLDTVRDPRMWRTSARVRTEWGFTSAADPSDPWKRVDIPLLQLDYGLRVTGARTEITLSGAVQEGLPVTGAATEATLAVSYDDGATWQPVRLRAEGAGRWTAAVRGGAISLKATAADRGGRTVSQEIIRAVVTK
ncbi:S8 family serine peptidase [Planomonospora venezuelensis]|uniref:Subtilisin family serine protease n=1 Tax=Planomonospora venezuelensis TaxID=1999 RepID=A0A841DA81_PLAVE|nr:S8 family serine peptidase [Planomonospora venezuelensis]MBB5967091.1 subtilisin family serine protease [Planomonospora venezuelensis]GIN04931.1 peptidase [Planomonospora venezuelensis]